MTRLQLQNGVCRSLSLNKAIWVRIHRCSPKKKNAGWKDEQRNPNAREKEQNTDWIKYDGADGELLCPAELLGIAIDGKVFGSTHQVAHGLVALISPLLTLFERAEGERTDGRVREEKDKQAPWEPERKDDRIQQRAIAPRTREDLLQSGGLIDDTEKSSYERADEEDGEDRPEHQKPKLTPETAPAVAREMKAPTVDLNTDLKHIEQIHDILGHRYLVSGADERDNLIKTERYFQLHEPALHDNPQSSQEPAVWAARFRHRLRTEVDERSCDDGDTETDNQGEDDR
eukprot:2132352-Prymnesium_polylepis.2